MTPRPKIPRRHTSSRLIIITREHIKERNLLDSTASRIIRNTADIQDSETGLVVRLICEAAVDELIVVDRLDGGLVEAGVDGVFEGCDVEDESGGEAVVRGARVGLAWGDDAFVEFVVEEEVGLPVGVEDPALVLWKTLAIILF